MRRTLGPISYKLLCAMSAKRLEAVVQRRFFLDGFTVGAVDDGWRTFKTKHNEKIIVNVLRPEMLAKGMGTVEFSGCRL